MNKTGQLIIGLAIAGGALYFTMRNISLHELMDSFRVVDYIYILPAFLMVTLSYLARAFRWRILLLSYREVKVSQLLSPLMVGFMGNFLPGRAGELIRPYLLKIKQGVSFPVAFATLVVERLFDLISLCILFVWVFVFKAEVFSTDAVFSGMSVRDIAVKFGQASALLVGGMIVFIYFLVWHKAKLMAGLAWVGRMLPQKILQKIEYIIEEFCLGFQVCKDRSALLKISFYSFLVWAMVVFAYYPLCLAYGLENQSLEMLLVLTVTVCIFSVILPTPAFLGSVNAGVLLALHHILGEAEKTAVSFGFVVWALGFLVVIIFGVYFILHDHLSWKELVQAKKEVTIKTN